LPKGVLEKVGAALVTTVDRLKLVEKGKIIVELIALIALNRADKCSHIIDRCVNVVDKDGWLLGCHWRKRGGQ
jgi:hypothetical protein